MKETPKNIGTLLLIGQEHRLWTNQMRCAEVLGQNYEEFRGDIRRPTTQRALRSREALMELLQSKNIDVAFDDLEMPLPESFRGLYFLGARLNLWKTYRECARLIGISEQTVSNYVDMAEENVTISARGKAEYGKAKEAIHSKVHPARKRMKVERGQEIVQSAPPPSSPNAQLPAQATEKATTTASLTLHDRQLIAVAVEEILARQPANDAVKTPCIRSSDWRNELVAGNMEVVDERTQTSLRFLLPSRVVPDAPQLTLNELTDTQRLMEKIEQYLKTVNVLLQEHRRRIQIACQKQEGRQQAVGKLLRPAKKMLGEAASTAVLLQALQEVDLDGNLKEYLDLFQRHFRSLFPPTLS